MHPLFKKKSPVDGYQFGVIGIFPDIKRKTAKAATEYSRAIKLDEKVTPLTIQLPIPRRAQTFLVCIRIDGCRNGKVDGPMTAKGMRMVGTGEI